MRTRRCKFFPLDDDVLLALLRHLSAPDGCLPVGWPLPCFRTDLPPDARIEAVHYDYGRACWLVLVAHPSWPEVEVGAEVPVAATDRMIWFERDPRLRAGSPARRFAGFPLPPVRPSASDYKTLADCIARGDAELGGRFRFPATRGL